MKTSSLQPLFCLILMAGLAVPATGMTDDARTAGQVSSDGKSYVNLQLCSNTYLEYRNRPQIAQQYLDASLKLQAAYTSGEQFDDFIDAIQHAHERQASLEVHEGESRGEFYRRVFSETRCEQALETVID